MQRNELLYTRSNRPGYRPIMEYQTYCPKLIHMCSIDNQKNHELEAIDEYGINIAIAYAINEHGIGPMREHHHHHHHHDESPLEEVIDDDNDDNDDNDDEALRCKRAKMCETSNRGAEQTARNYQRKDSIELYRSGAFQNNNNKTITMGESRKTTVSTSSTETLPVRSFVDHHVQNDTEYHHDHDHDDDVNGILESNNDISDLEFLNEAVSYAIINRGLSTTMCNLTDDPSDVEPLSRNSSSL